MAQPPQRQSNNSGAHDDPSQRLSRVLRRSTDKLLRAKTVFPFTLFPTELAIDREKVTVTYRAFFSVVEVISIRIDDVVGVVATAGPVFGSVAIFNRHHSPEEPNRINYLRKRDALRAKRLLEGYIIAAHRDINLADMDRGELIAKLMDLGAGTPDEDV